MIEKTSIENTVGRKAIFVHVSVFEAFKSAAKADGRQYSQFLEMLLLERKATKKRK
jgi:hypothetical protein